MNTENLKKEIKKIRIGHVALICTGVFLGFLIIGSVLLAAGGFNLATAQGVQWGNFFINFGPGTTYDVNDHKELDMTGVNSLVILTVSDDVTIGSGGEKTVADLTGQCRTSGTPVHLETRLNGGTLTVEVKYPIGSNRCSTRLAVSIPAGYQGNLTVTTVSGSINAERMPFRLQQVDLGTTSGDIRFSTESYTRLKAGSISGEADISGISATTTVNTVSGNVALDYNQAAEATVTTVSGDVKAVLPGNAKFGVDFGSVSGSFRSAHPNLEVTKAGRGFSALKEGAPQLRVHTTSGDFQIEGK